MRNTLRSRFTWAVIWLTLGAGAMAATLVTSSIDSGGQRASSASYLMDGSVGGIGGISSAAADTAKNSYIGQLTEVVSLSVTGAPAAVNQGATSQLSGAANLDDDTVTVLTGAEVVWNPVSYPLQSIDSNGLVTAVANVYEAPFGSASGTYLGITGAASLQVLGPYANAGIPDSWYAQYFGTPPNPLAAPTVDADGTGQNNQFKYVAGLDPTNPASVFVLQIANVDGQPDQKDLLYTPVADGRTYTVEYTTDLTSDSYTNLVAVSGPITNGVQVTVTDTNATTSTKFYRVNISYP